MLANYKETLLDQHINADLPKFSFEVEFYRKDDPRHLTVQRFPVHFEDSDTLLDDSKCVKIPIKDIQRFLDEDKNLFYRLRITSCKVKIDRWDELLTRARNKMRGSEQDSNFAFFDALDDENVFTDDSNSAASIDRKQKRDDDVLKQIFQREFPDTFDESTRLLTKPPRKSLENRHNDVYKTKDPAHRNTVKFSE